jgi:type I restriction enzyme S subunit
MELVGANIARQVGLIRLRKTVNSDFVRYYLQSASGVEALGARESGSVQQVINLSELRHVSVPYPDKAGQNAIVESLDKMALKIQRLESIYQCKLAALDELKKSLLHQAFCGRL